VRQYLLFLRQHKRYKHSPMKAAMYALLCFFLDCVKVKGGRSFMNCALRSHQVLPVVLSRTEVQSLLSALTEPRFRVCLRLMYHCGLRGGETVRIELKDIHGRENPPRLHIRNGKRRQGPLRSDHLADG
jgi:integrase